MRKIWLLLPALILLGCAVQKRKYQKGFYINWNRQASAHKEKRSENLIAKTTAKEFRPAPLAETIQDAGVLNVSAGSELLLPAKPKTTILTADEPCDELIFRDGLEIKGKVLEITPTEVKYKKCSMLDGPTYIGKKSDIFMIKYANGTREVFKEEPKTQGQSSSAYPKKGVYTGPKQTHPLAVASLVMGILCIIPYVTLIAAILAIVFGNSAIRKIQREPDRYKGEGIAMAGKIIGIVILSILALALIIGLLVLILIV